MESRGERVSVDRISRSLSRCRKVDSLWKVWIEGVVGVILVQWLFSFSRSATGNPGKEPCLPSDTLAHSVPAKKLLSVALLGESSSLILSEQAWGIPSLLPQESRPPRRSVRASYGLPFPIYSISAALSG